MDLQRWGRFVGGQKNRQYKDRDSKGAGDQGGTGRGHAGSVRKAAVPVETKTRFSCFGFGMPSEVAQSCREGAGGALGRRVRRWA